MNTELDSLEIAPTMSPRYAAYLRSYLLDCGADVEALFAEGGLSLGESEERTRPIPVSTVSRVFEVSAKRLGDPYFGLHMAQQFHYESSGLMMLTVLAAPTVEAGLKTLVRYDKYIDPGIETGLILGQKQTEFRVSLIDPQSKPHEQLIEHLIGSIFYVLGQATRKSVPVKEVWFKHSVTKQPQEFRKAFGVPVKFRQEWNKLVFDSAFLQESFVTANSLLYEILTKALHTYFSSSSENFDLLEAVCREVIRQAAVEAPSIESVADSLSLSARTLRRRLAEEGSSFQDVKRLARENRAKYFLAQTSMSLSEIALELGYSELSAFSRAFRSWCGETPQKYRSRAKEEGFNPAS